MEPNKPFTDKNVRHSFICKQILNESIQFFLKNISNFNDQYQNRSFLKRLRLLFSSNRLSLIRNNYQQVNALNNYFINCVNDKNNDVLENPIKTDPVIKQIKIDNAIFEFCKLKKRKSKLTRSQKQIYKLYYDFALEHKNKIDKVLKANNATNSPKKKVRTVEFAS